MSASDAGSRYSTLGVRNPFRYRGYYYDAETSLYYVKSRYYESEIGRWINADDVVASNRGISDNNVYAYCDDNPVDRIDSEGDIWEALVIGFAFGFVEQYLDDVLKNIHEGKTGSAVFKRREGIDVYLLAGLSGALTSCPGLGVLGGAAMSAFTSVAMKHYRGELENVTSKKHN